MNENSTLCNREHQEITVLYQIMVQDLAQFKNQQWTLTNYTILVFAAIISVSEFDDLKLSLCGSFLLCLVASVIFGIAVHILWQLRASIEIRRKRIKHIIEKYSEVYRSCLGKSKKVNSGEMFFFLLFILLMGLGFVWWLVYFHRLMT